MMNNTDLMSLERQDRIANMVNERGSLTVVELSQVFAVSEATIRRDLVALAERRLVQRVHGGAMRIGKVATSESPIIHRQLEHVEEKARIGRATAQLIRTGDTVLLLGGSTGLAVARELAQHDELTIVTDSLLIASELLDQKQHKVVLAGGTIDPDEQAVRGTLSRLILQQLHVDKVIMGAKAISVLHGISAETPEEAELFRACIACADQMIVVTDSSKFQKSALAKVVAIEDIHTLVTDHALSEELVRKIHDLGIHLVLA
ncbi:MAG: DeoR/GlpR transcriptional regulator [Anaerolineae bacterium]|nr:DeoR/GlpR transcriptional regulator [Anaerolineae bacterium]MBN8620179.1 DeoR/GlpR transcriptional regulator [Anaerolineae bacterium]